MFLKRRLPLFLLSTAILVCAALNQGCSSNTPESTETVEAKEQRKPSGAWHALNFWAAKRAYPNRAIPDDSFASAYSATQKIRARSSEIDDRMAPWDLIGPYNIGGRTLCLAMHPNDPDILFAGGASGGLWKSTTGGVGADAWDYVETGFPVLGVSTIAIDAVDPDVMYIGTGEVYRYQDSIGGEVIRTTRGSYGIGILKTIDGGETWTKSLDWTYAQSRGIWMIAIHPLNSQILYAATTEGVYKSADTGNTWIPSLERIMATDVRIHPTQPNVIFTACGNFGSTGHGIYRSTDDGLNWSKLTNGLPSSWTGKTQLAIAPTSPNRIYASIADDFNGRGLYRSLDTGDTWSLVNSTDYPKYQGWFAHYVLVSPFDEDRVFVGGVEIWGSSNGGFNLTERSRWTEVYYGTSPPEGPIGGPRYAHADHHFAMWHPTEPDTIFFASDGGVFKSTDGGYTFQSLIGGYVTTQFYNGFSVSAQRPNFAMGGLQDNFTAIYENDAAWRRVIGGDGCWTAINAQDSQTIYGSAQYLQMFRSRDSGNDWTGVSPPSMGGDQTAFVAPYVLSPSDPNVLYAGRSRVYKSVDEGSDWDATNEGQPLDGSNPVLCLEISKTDPDIVYAGTAPISTRARVFRTLDGGGDWDDITGSLPDLYPADIAVAPGNPDTVFIAFMGYENEHVFRSDNAGTTWTDVTGNLPDVPVSALAIDPRNPSIVYAGTDLGVFISTEGGTSWATFMNGMPTTMVTDLNIFTTRKMMQPESIHTMTNTMSTKSAQPDITYKIRASTHGNGVFERKLYRSAAPLRTLR